MRNFPPPHQSELLYSTIARASIYGGITSPKILLDEVFGTRNVIATLDLPSHINHISHLLRGTGRHSAEQLIFNHTLFPLDLFHKSKNDLSFADYLYQRILNNRA